jgi:hypothetical protein
MSISAECLRRLTPNELSTVAHLLKDLLDAEQ